MESTGSDGLSRRSLVKAAIAIGGTSALGACQSAEDPPTDAPSDGPSFPRGVDDPDSLPTRQHAWDQYLVHSAHGTTIQGQHQLMLGLSYEGSMPPTQSERDEVESAFRTLERAFQWGSGADTSGAVNSGLLFLIGYAPSFVEDVGFDVDGLHTPSELLEAIGEDPDKADDFDALLLLDSDYGSILLEAEEAMFGDLERVNGVSVEAQLRDTFEVVERRSGFLGKGLPAEELDNENVPDDAMLSMGFRAGFDNSLPSEDSVTWTEGPFAEGTTLVTARLETNLDDWYDKPLDDRRKQMYCPAHTEEEVGAIGDRLGNHSQITSENVDRLEELAQDTDMVGHAQKVASARDDDSTTRILRRSEGVATDEVHGTVFNFSSVQRDTQAFVDVRSAMKVDAHEVDVRPERHGIVDFLETVARGTFLVPQRSRRSLPVPR